MLPVSVIREASHWSLRLQESKISVEWLQAFHHGLDEIEADSRTGVVLVQSSDDAFCSGMNASTVVGMTADEREDFFRSYIRLLSRLAALGKYFIASVEGDAVGGGLGLLAVMDFVVADRRTHYCLPETLLGLVPACILPFVARRIGYHLAYQLSLTTLKIDALRAREISLVDLVSDDVSGSLSMILSRIRHVDPDTVRHMKEYYSSLNAVNTSALQNALELIVRLTGQRHFRERVQRFYPS